MNKKTMLITLAISVSGFLLVACKGTLEEQVAAEVAQLENVLNERLDRIDQISDPEMRNSFSYLADMMFFFDKTNAESVIPPEQIRYTQSVLEHFENYEDPADLIDAFVNSIWVEGDNDFGYAIPTMAFDYPQKHNLVWTNAILSDGTKIPIENEFNENFEGVVAIDDGWRIRIFSSETDSMQPSETQLPKSIEGTFTTTAIETVYTANFSESSVGQLQTIGPYDVTLKSIEGHIVTVDIARTDGTDPQIDTDFVFVEARDDTGMIIDDRSKTWGDQKQLQLFQKSLDVLIDKAIDGEITETDAQRLYEKIMAEYSGEDVTYLSTTVEYTGFPTSVDVIILQNAEVETTTDISLPVTYLDPFSESKIPTEIYIDLPIADTEVERMLSSLPQEVAAEEIASLVTPIQSEYYSQVEFEYPKVQSSIFIDGFDRFTDKEDRAFITFFDESGEPISVTYENEYEFTVNRIEYDQTLFPVKPDRVAGKIFVNRLLSMTQETFMKDELPDGISLDRNMIILDGSVFGSNEYKYRIFALGENGQPLQKFATGYIKSDDGNNIKVSYHYGDVAGIVILRRGEAELVPYEFDIKIVPPKEY